MVLAAAVDALPGSYALVVTEMGRESKPTFEMLQQRCEFHFVNVLKQGELRRGATDSATAAHGVLKGNNDKKKIVCATCAGNGHATKACWLTNPAKLEDYIKRFPKEETRIRAAVEERWKELKVKEKAAAAVMTDDEVWNAEGHKEVLIACSAVSSAATSCTNPFADGYVVSSAATRCTNPFADDYVVSSSDSDGASSSSAVSSASNGASTLSSASSAASTVEMGAARRVLHFDSMATTSIFNDVSFFIDGTVCADSALSFRVMAGQVTASQGGGVGYVEVWNLVTEQTDKVLIEAQYVPNSPFNLISAVALEDTYDLYATFVERELQSGDGTTRHELVREGEVFALPEVYDRLHDRKLYHEKVTVACAAVNLQNEFGNLCLSSAPTTTTVSPVNLRSAGELEDTYGLHEKNVTVVLEASRAVHIQEWVLQYDNRLTVSESDPSVYFIDIPNVLMVQLNFSTNDVECITSSEEWRTTFLKAFNAKWSRS
ncbi:hypothetical protein CYMTET_5647 [Cymbomonas tetramitiformis]|uniref:Uncharacterized protein n=1 Tax=Cymbomonas tetramitiformis TaxID=36881 RepID=A0AAE0LIV4_9CHLO|nr:hypothetical protein CYMTET_5647 [Cymbomonas tetramitiformis]